MIADLKYACRQLARSPGFTVIVVATLALAIGACTVIFTAINATLLHPVPGPNADRTVLIYETRLPQVPQMQLSPPAFLDLAREAQSFEFVSAWTGFSANLTGGSEPARLTGAYVSAHQFEEWGIQIALGRAFAADEFTPGKNHVAIISYAFWQRGFGGAPDIIGRAVQLDGTPVTIVGVMGEAFARYGSDTDICEPLVFSDADRSDRMRGQHYLQGGGLLKPGVTLAAAQAELSVLAARMAQQYPTTNQGNGLMIRYLGDYLNRTLGPLLYLLLGAVSCVLLIACANVANLLLARASARQREVALRAALGAGRGRLIRQLLIESVLLALLGGLGGVLFAEWGLAFIRAFAPVASTDLARLAYVELDGRMLAFALVFSAGVGVLFGLAPAWMGSRVELSQALKQSARGSSGGAASGRLRGALVVAEVAMALVLVASAGLLIRSFQATAQVDPGFVPARVISLSIGLPAQKYSSNADARRNFGLALLPRLRALPGVESAAIATLLPFDNPRPYPFAVEGNPVTAVAQQPAAVLYGVTPDYFQVMGIRLTRGREFSARDGVTGPTVVLINRTLASDYFPNQDPIGKRVNLASPGGPPFWAEVVGEVGDVMQGAPGQAPLPQMYYSWLQESSYQIYVIVRTRGDPAAVLSLVKPQVYAVDPDQPVATLRTLTDWMDSVLAAQRLTLRLLSAFALIAFAIALVGIYGVMAYDVSQRTMEFGIRMALGANHRQVLWQVLRRGMGYVGAGVGIGLGLTLGFGRLFAALLFKTSAFDPATIAGVVGALLLVAFGACFVPARRATRVDPLVALRAE